MRRILGLFILAAIMAGCRSYVESTPRQIFEGDNPANYKRAFREPVPAGVTVVNSAVVTYSYRPGVNTSGDFEFELLAPRQWIERTAKHLQHSDNEFMRNEMATRRQNARSWYAPKSLSEYEFYRDFSSVGYFHMMVQKEAESDGRYRVFLSKH